MSANRLTPKLSILIPTYNRAEMLRECLESSLTAPADAEIVVIDNGSTDCTTDVTQSFAARDPRVHVVRQPENVGPLRNFQRALEEARGDYICLTGDDDLFLPGNFQKKLALLDARPEIGLVYSQWLRIDEHSRSQGVVMWPGVLSYSYVGTRDEFRDLLPASYMMFQAVVFRRELYDRFDGFDEHPDRLVGNDWDLLLRYCYHTKTAFIAEPLVAVRVHQQSFTELVARKDGKFAPGRIAIWRKWLVEHENPPVLDEALWRRMAEAFLPDLGYEFGQDQARIDYYLQQLEAVKRDSMRRVAQIASLASEPVALAALSSSSVTRSNDAVIRSTAAVSLTAAFRSEHPSIIFTSPLFEASSAGENARSLALALEEAGCIVAAETTDKSRGRATLIAQEELRLRSMVERTPERDSIHFCHATPPDFRRRTDASVNIGVTEFFSGSLPEGWAAACNRMDEIWVPSEFNRESFAQAGVDERKLWVMPGVIDVKSFSECTERQVFDGARGFNFLSVFDWDLRSGWDVLVRAFVSEFDASEEVALILSTRPSGDRTGSSIDSGGELIAFLRDELGRDPENIPDIVLETAELPSHQMPSHYRAADCFVLASRGEARGRRTMEAMASGPPVIGTNWGGNREFMTAENSFLVDTTEGPVSAAAIAEMPHLAGLRWAEPNVTHLRSRMRHLFESREMAAQIGLAGQRTIVEQFDSRAATHQYLARLSGITSIVLEAA